MAYGRYHWRDGVYFQRQQTNEGEVEIEIPGGQDGETFHYFIPPAEWASIVAAVCAEGDNAERYAEALKLHMERTDGGTA